LLFGLLLFRQPQDEENIAQLTARLEREILPREGEESVESIHDLMRCENCVRCFLRGVFLACGTVGDPAKQYHLEMVLPDAPSAEDLVQLIEKMGISPKRTIRRGHDLIYLKDNESISDFLSLIGAQNAVFAIINEKIRKEIRNDANRRTNCDAANINKAITAAMIQLEAIQILKDNGQLGNLPKELNETAILRDENPDATLQELAALHHPPITKSGVNHRLKKIVDISREH